ncbi:Mitochondrial S-adenosylmethionine carrier protein [Sphaerulina musiva]
MASSNNNTNADIWLAGALAAFTVDLIVYPLDTVKTRLQSPAYRTLYRNASNTAFTPALYRGLYQGVGSVIIATLPSSGAFFSTYEGIKTLLGDNGNAVVNAAAASGIAELVSCAILTPAEVLKQNAQMVNHDNVNPTLKNAKNAKNAKNPSKNATLHTLQRFRSNPLALWRGYAALAGRNLPFTAMQFPLFEHIKTSIRRHRDDRGTRTNTLLESAIITAVSAGAGGSVAAVATTPVDVVKTRLMLTAAAAARQSVKQAKDAVVDATAHTIAAARQNPWEAWKGATSAAPGRKSSLTVAREVMQQEGVKGLFRGGALRAVWTMIGSGLYLGVYETGRIYLAQRRRAGDEAEE